MNRLEQTFRKKINKSLVDTKIKAVNLALDSAMANAESDKIQAELDIENVLSNFADGKYIETFIQSLSEKFDMIENAELSIERIEKIRKYLAEDVEVEEDEKVEK